MKWHQNYNGRNQISFSLPNKRVMHFVQHQLEKKKNKIKYLAASLSVPLLSRQKLLSKPMPPGTLFRRSPRRTGVRRSKGVPATDLISPTAKIEPSCISYKAYIEDKQMTRTVYGLYLGENIKLGLRQNRSLNFRDNRGLNS